jgi:ABC-type lipoprotein release transport system permease subunit
MSLTGLLLRNLLYHWRGNLAVFLGIGLGSAVLTGALLVGDSLRGSLKALTLDQLGWVENALVPGRFFRAELAKEVAADRRAPALLLQGSAAGKNSDMRVGKVTVLGIDASFWPDEDIPQRATIWSSEEGEVVLNRTLAGALEVSAGDSVDLYLQRASNVPNETLMGQRKAENVTQKITAKVRAVVGDQGMARFSLQPTPEPVRNAFVPIRFLQKKLDLPGRVNALFVANAKPSLQSDLHGHLTLEDWGLRYRSPKDRAEAFFRLLAANSSEPALKISRWRGRLPEQLAKEVEAEIEQKKVAGLTKNHLVTYYEKNRAYHALESQRMLLEPYIVRAVENLAPEQPEESTLPRRWDLKPILVYLADTLTDGKYQVPYAIVASDDRFVIKDGKKQYLLAASEILLTAWPGSPLKVKPSSVVTLKYFSPDDKNQLTPKEEKFKVESIVKLEGKLDDPDLTPEFPGVTDKLKMDNWENPPFPFDPKRIKKPDEDYWTRYRTTPKAYINLKKAQKMWGSRFGDLTSIQVRPGREQPETLPKALLEELKPEQGGFVFQSVREQALRASSGTTPFGVLFLAFSVFLIASALLLVGLLVRLNLDRRAGEMGLLCATGWEQARVRWLLLGEGALLAVSGGLVGLAGAMLYAGLMLKWLAANWPGGASLSFLTLHAEPASFAIGYAASLLVSMLTLFWATRVLGKASPRSLLYGELAQTGGLADAAPGWSRWLIPAGVIGALALAIIGRFLPSQEAQAGSFFGSGALLLIASLASLWYWFKWSNRSSSPQPSLSRLGMRNAGRHAVRSLLTVGLLAAASFLIVAVESFHKETDKHFYHKTGGSGGFALYAEGSVPIFEDLNQSHVRRERGLDTPEMRTARFYSCRVQAGDDASCLNLYKPLKPRIMSVPNDFIKRGGFHFGKTDAQSAEEKANPWLLLHRPSEDAIPAIVDANTARWILNVPLGGTIEVNNDKGEPVKLRVVALLQESIFQSEVLIAEKQFLTLFPRQQGFSFLLLDAGTDDAQKLQAIQRKLSKSMLEYNMDVQTTASRLQSYLAVENTYLATFQALGGLGLVLGAAGLAIVLLRGVWERRAELALFAALGFRTGQLAWLVLVENVFLLVLGLVAGIVSALLAVAPHLAGSGAQVLWLRIAALLALVLAVGLLSAVLAVWSTLKTPVLAALRRE